MSYDLDRKELKRDDLFLQKLNQFWGVVRKNRAAFLAISAVFVLGGGGFGAYKAWQISQEEKAATAYYPVEKQVLDAMHQPNAKTDPDWAKKAAPLIAQVQALMTQYRFTKVAYQGRMLLADLELSHDQYQSAADRFKDAVMYAQNRYEKVAALYSSAIAFEDAKMTDQAIPLLRQALASGVNQSKANVLIALSRNLHAKGDDAEAKRELSEVKTEFPNTAWSASAEEMERSWSTPTTAKK